MKKKASDVLFASAIPERLDRDLTLPARFTRLLDRLPIQKRVKGKSVAIKMHVGGGIGYSTIHPLFVKLVVDHVMKGGPRDVFVTDGDLGGAPARGYAKETVGARLAPACGNDGKDVVSLKTGWKPMDNVLVGKPIVDADVLINLSHVKGHGACGFGGACKNLAMGCVPPGERGRMHAQEGKLEWVKDKCTHCKKCIEECEMKANHFTDSGEYEIFWHNCKGCLHCMLACPKKAIRIVDRKFALFQEGLARVTKLVLDSFEPGNVFNINVLMNITIFCDCWGFTTPALVPDVGIMASEDLVAVDHASLDAIDVKNLIPGSITPPYKLGKGKHLFERLHAKDPYMQVKLLEKIGAGSSAYKLVPVK